MNEIAIAVIYGNPQSEEWETVESRNIDPYEAPDFSSSFFSPVEYNERGWFTVELPNSEKVEIRILFNAGERDLEVSVRQNDMAIAQVQCEGTPSIIFRTLQEASVNIQVFEESI